MEGPTRENPANDDSYSLRCAFGVSQESPGCYLKNWFSITAQISSKVI